VKKHARDAMVKRGDLSKRVGVEQIRMRGREGVSRPSGHFRRGAPGEAPYSKNAGFYNP
jgi:hypothetical protein